MIPSTTRRKILQYSLGALAVQFLQPFSPVVRAASAAAFTQLNGKVALLNVGGSNVLALPAAEGLVLVDSGAPGHSDTLQSSLAELGAGRVGTLFNTHWHEEHTGANVVLGEAGTRIVAHEKTRLRLSTDYYIPHEERYHRALPKAGQPSEGFFTTGSMTAGSEHIDYGYLMQAHTDGDIFVYFRDANVLAAGDVASPERDPAHDWYGGGWIGGRVDAMDLLLELSNDDTQIVPAFGPVMSRTELQAERDMMAFLHERMGVMVREGKGARDILDAGLMNGLLRTWNDPYKFLYDAHKGLWAHHNKIGPNIL